VIQAVFFDLYNTLCRFDPAPEVSQVETLFQEGVSIDKASIAQAYPFADDYMADENERWPIKDRSLDERKDFFSHYEHVLLQKAGLDVSLEFASKIFARLRDLPQKFALFEDVITTLEKLKSEGKMVGILSNLDQDIDQVIDALSLSDYIDCAISSLQVGVSKPDPVFFQAALQRLDVTAGEAIHVGDQYKSDIQGARAAGIRPVLINRIGHSLAPDDCPQIESLEDLFPIIREFESDSFGI